MTPPVTTNHASVHTYSPDLFDGGVPYAEGPYLTALRTESRVEIYETTPPATPIADAARSVWDSVVSWWNGPQPVPKPVIQHIEVRPDFDPVASAHRIFEATQGGLTGLGTDEAAVTAEYTGLTPAQADTLEITYKDHYGVTATKHTDADLSGLAYEEVAARRRGEQRTGDALALGNAFRYGTQTVWDLARTGTDEAQVFATLEGKTAEEIAEIDRVFTHRFGITLHDALASELSGHDLAEAQALMSGRDTTAQAVRLQRALTGWSTDTKTVETILTTTPPEKRLALAEEYSHLTGQTLETSFDFSLWGTEKDRANALLHGDSAAARAAALFEAQLGPGTDEARISKELSGLTRDELQATKEAYKRQYQRELSRDLASELSGIDYEITANLLKSGEISPAQQIRRAVEGVGTDETALLDSLRGKSFEEIAHIRADYYQRYGEELDTRVLNELSGRDYVQAEHSLHGAPIDAEGVLAQLRDRITFERAGVSGYLLDKVSSKGDLLERNIHKAEMTFEAIQADGKISPEEHALLVERYRFALQDLGSYQTAKDTAADTAGTVGAVALGAGSMLATAGMSTPIVVGSAATAGGAGYIGAKAVVAGKAYDRHGMVADGTIGIIEGGVVGATGGVLSGRLREVSSHFAGGSLGGATRETLDQNTWQNGIINGLQRVGKAAVQEGGIGIIAGQAFKVSSSVVNRAYRDGKFWLYNKKLPENLIPVFAEVKDSPLFGIRAQEHFEELRKRFGDDTIVNLSTTRPSDFQAELILLELEHIEPSLGPAFRSDKKRYAVTKENLERIQRSIGYIESARGKIPQEVLQALNERLFDNALFEKQKQSEM